MDKFIRVSPVVLGTALLLMTGAAQAAQVDVAVNGGFETGDFTGWTTFNSGGIEQVVMPGNGSDYSANLGSPLGQPTDVVIKNANLAAGLLTPGAAITVTFDILGVASAPGAVVFVELFSELDGGGVSKAEFFTGGPLFPNDPVNWTSYVWNTTLGPDVAGGVTLQLKTGCGAVLGCSSDVFFDNITITTDVAPIPVPAAVWLFGSALGLLGWMRRKVS